MEKFFDGFSSGFDGLVAWPEVSGDFLWYALGRIVADFLFPVLFVWGILTFLYLLRCLLCFKCISLQAILQVGFVLLLVVSSMPLVSLILLEFAIAVSYPEAAGFGKLWDLLACVPLLLCSFMLIGFWLVRSWYHRYCRDAIAEE